MAKGSMAGSSRSSSSGASPEAESKVLEGPGVSGGEGPAPRTRRTAPPATSERHVSVLSCTTASTIASLVAWICWGCTSVQPASSGCVLLGLGCRVVGACVLGQVADGSKQGRKGTLCWSMALIGMATLLMSALPHGAFKGGRGHWQALVLVALQCVGLGGEWGSSVVLPYESCCDDASRCLAPAFPHAFVPIGMATGLVLVALCSHWPALAPLPFVVGGMAALCVAWGVRRYMKESPLYKDLLAHDLTHTCPLFECIRRQWRSLVVGLCISAMTTFGRFALLAPYAIGRVAGKQQHAHPLVVAGVWVSMSAVGLWTVFGGWLGSPTRLSRRPLFITAALLLAGVSLAVHPTLLKNAPVQRMCVEVFVMALLLGLLRGLMPSLVADLFDTRTRHSACGIVFHSTYGAMAVTASHFKPQYEVQSPTPAPSPVSPAMLITLVLALLAVLGVYAGASSEHPPCATLLPSSSLSVAEGVAQWGRRHSSHSQPQQEPEQ